MNAFVVVAFHDAAMLHRGIGTLEKLQTEGKVKLYASTAVARDSNGKLSVQETTKEGLGATAVGALIGGVAGLPLGPLAMTIGAAAGATIGMSADLLNEGDEGKFAEK